MANKPLTLVFHTRRFFCDNENCFKKTFAEQPGTEIFKYQRKTRTAEIAICKTSLACTSRLAAGQLQCQGIPISRRTVLRHVHKVTMPILGDYTEVGVDDWAYRKGVNYGSIIVNLQNHMPLAILETRKSEDFQSWLRDHPEVSLVSRDRASEYSAAVKAQDRYICQVADRFHLLENIWTVFQDIADTYYGESVAVVKKHLGQGEAIEDQTSPRAIKFRQVKELQRNGVPQIEIHHLTGVSLSAIARYFKIDKIYKVVRTPKYDYESYRPVVEQGIRDGKILRVIYEELKAAGNRLGSLRPFQEYFSSLSKSKSKDSAVKTNNKTISRRKVVKVASKAVNKPDKLNETERQVFEALMTQSWYRRLFKIVSDFVAIVRQGRGHNLREWLRNNSKSEWPRLITFCKGILQDYDAVINALHFRDVSQGPVEGIVNRIKTLRRAMGGRCSNALLLLKIVGIKCYFT